VTAAQRKEEVMRDPLKSPRCVLLFLALSVCLICISCDSSSGGGEATSEEAVRTLDSYDFSLWVDKNHGGPLSANLTVNFQDETEISINTSDPITGIFDVKAKSYSIHAHPNQIEITITPEKGTPRTFNVQFIEDIFCTRDALPTKGKFYLLSGGNFITVTMAPKGAYLKLNNDASTFFTWKGLDDLLRESQFEWQQDASLAATVVSLLMDQIHLVLFTKECMNKYKLEDGIPVSIPSGTFPPDSVSSDQENLWLNWTDKNKDRVLGKGDSFTWIFENSWEDEPSDEVDELYLGKVDLRGYTENIMPGDDDKDTLMSFGFSPDSSTGEAGVFYDPDFPLDITKTLSASTKGSSIRLVGGFGIDFTGNED
jgi:hypothetical protein